MLRYVSKLAVIHSGVAKGGWQQGRWRCAAFGLALTHLAGRLSYHVAAASSDVFNRMRVRACDSCLVVGVRAAAYGSMARACVLSGTEEAPCDPECVSYCLLPRGGVDGLVPVAG